MRLRAVGVAACLILVSTAAQAQHSDADQFLSVYYDEAVPLEFKQELTKHLLHIEEGLNLANAELTNHHKEPLYCQPPDLAIADEQLVAILRDEVKEVPPAGKFPYGLVLLKGLERVFPCKSTPQ